MTNAEMLCHDVERLACILVDAICFCPGDVSCSSCTYAKLCFDFDALKEWLLSDVDANFYLLPTSCFTK